ncbi:MAG: metalloregulator ArsR/SmtB family transcription factor [Aquiluna sp.]|nr:metalloregulator ArsR/SmtB family transcription factor [Aquiluna sp.]
MATALKAVADPTRLQILAMIAASEDQESCVCNLTEPLDLTQPTISHHLKKLAEAGLIRGERRGTWVWYSLNKERWSQIANLFNA